MRRIAQVDPKALLTAELRWRARTLHERSPVVRTQAPRQRGVQSGRRIQWHQLNGVELACARQARAACQKQVPSATCVRMPTFPTGMPFRQGVWEAFLDLFEKADCEKHLAKIQIFVWEAFLDLFEKADHEKWLAKAKFFMYWRPTYDEVFVYRKYWCLRTQLGAYQK